MVKFKFYKLPSGKSNLSKSTNGGCWCAEFWLNRGIELIDCNDPVKEDADDVDEDEDDDDEDDDDDEVNKFSIEKLVFLLDLIVVLDSFPEELSILFLE